MDVELSLAAPLIGLVFVFRCASTTLTSNYSCSLQGRVDMPGFLADGDFTIGGIFPLHYRVELPVENYTDRPAAAQCLGFDPRSFRWAQALRFAIQEINQSKNLLPNITLGYKIYDSCSTPLLAQQAVLAVLNGPELSQHGMCSDASPVLAVVAESGSSQSIVVSRTLQPFRIPVISYFSTCSCLSNRREFPTFFRVLPNDDYQVKAIAQLLKHFGWTWIGVITEDHDYGKSAVQGLRIAIKDTGACIAYHEMIPKVYNEEKVRRIIDVMKHSTAKVVVIFTVEGELYPFLKEYMNYNITGIQLIASEAWVTASVLATSYPFLVGTIGFAIRQGKVPGLKDYLLTVNPLMYPSHPLVQELWEALYGCSVNPPKTTSQNSIQLPTCTGEEPIREQHSSYLNTSSLRVTYNVYKAVYAIAHSLHNLFKCEPGKGPFQNSSCANNTNIYPWQLQQYLQEVSFTISGETVNFDEKGDAIPSYDLINWQRGVAGNIEFVRVGMFDGSKDAGKELFIQDEAIMWTGHQREVLVSVCSDSCIPGSRKAFRRGEPFCCFDCVPCDSNKISNETDSVDCTPCPEDYWSNTARTECILKAVEFLTHDAMGLTLTVISVVGACLTAAILLVFIRHRNTPIVRVNNSELSFFILLSLILCFLCALLFIGEPTVWSCMLRHTAFSITFSLCISCILGKTLVVLAAFTATRPGNNIMKWLGPKQQRVIIFACTLVQVLICSVWLIAAPPFPFKNTQYSRSKIILECSVGSDWAFWSVLGYIGLLACLCFVLAFLARKLPGNFNEAKYITFSMLIFCAVWLAFIPAYVSSPGKFTVAVEIFAILASSFGILLCLFAPKCCIILLKPKKNTKQHLLGKVIAK
ncbi:extracellular calcium-sensing receptor-like [Scleropages formosus]|uniref:extracellular calcium-sensing receptor-like n=1 Tax=Scleropages formosus TaxID=113540 RepID=UPI0010FA8927|nr:extracellular calcium-sensing receptor-like [Scleropages formosus]